MADDIVWAPADRDEYQQLQRAAIGGNLQLLAEAMKSDIDVNIIYGDGFEGRTVLHEAAFRGHVDVIRYLLTHGASVDVLDQDQHGCSSPLFYAALGARVSAVQALLDAGADVSIEGSNDRTILSAVLPDAVQVRQSHFDIINLLLDRGVDVNTRVSEFGPTAIGQAVKAASQPLIKMLLSRGATLEGSLGVAAEFHQDADTVNFLLDQGAKDIDSYALSRAACRNKAEIARVLLTRSDKPASRDSSYGPLQMAALMGHVDMVELLLNHGQAINSIDEWGRTPLIAACGAVKPVSKVVRILLDRGADPNGKTIRIPGSRWEGNDTPLHVSARGSNLEIIHLLLGAGADVTCLNNIAQTPLIKFAFLFSSQTMSRDGSSPRLDAFQLLLEAGSDVNATELNGRTALHVLTAYHVSDDSENRLKGAQMLLDRGIDTLKRDKDGKTAADLLELRETGFAQLLNSSSQSI